MSDGLWRRGAAVVLSEAARMVRLRSVWTLLAAVLLMSLAITVFPNPAFHQEGVSSLQAFASLHQLFATCLVAVALLVAAPPARRAWWPWPPGASLALESLGAWLASGLVLAATLALQVLLAALQGDLTAAAPLDPEPRSLLPGYLELLMLDLLFLMVLLAWGRLLITALPRSVGLLVLFVLMFSGFLLARLVAEYPAIRVMLVLVPDLRSLAPVQVGTDAAHDLPALAAYAVAHASCIWCLAATLVQIQLRRGRGLGSS